LKEITLIFNIYSDNFLDNLHDKILNSENRPEHVRNIIFGAFLHGDFGVNGNSLFEGAYENPLCLALTASYSDEDNLVQCIEEILGESISEIRDGHLFEMKKRVPAFSC